MKIANYKWKDKEIRTGAVIGDYIVDLNRAYERYLEYSSDPLSYEIAQVEVSSNIHSFINGGMKVVQKAQKALDFLQSKQALKADQWLIFDRKDVSLKAPLNKPGKIICVGHNYREHILEMGREIPSTPVIFAKFANTIIGPEDDIPKFDALSDQYDYEAEFAFVVGKKARFVSKKDALDHVFGYTIANDVSVRDLQKRTVEWLQGKTVEGTLPLGPWIVTSDELNNPSGLTVELKVNGETRQKSNTANLVFDVPFLVEFLSNLMTLEPGDLILTGTPGGVGVARNPQVFLQDGDVVTISIDQIGVLENKVQSVKTNVEV